MSMLGHISRILPRQLLQLEGAAASGWLWVLPSSHPVQTAGLSSLAHAAAAQQQPLGATQPWYTANSSTTARQGGAWQQQALRRYSQCDCPTLGGPTPDIVVVEFDDEEVDRFIALADAIEEAFPNVVVEGNPQGPGRPGSFEVKAASGQVLFSRLGSGGWPQSGAVVEALAASAAACDVAATAAKAGSSS